MRRKDRQITDLKEMLKIMRKCDCCRLGLRDENGVYIVPMNFGIAEQDSDIKLYFHCAESGRKTDILRSDPNVVFEMDTGHSLAAGSTACSCTFLYQSIMGKGVASIIEDTEEKIFGLTCIMQHYGHENLCDFKKDVLKKTQVIRLTISEWTCKQNKDE